jgi:hypothetical protein
VGTVLYFNLYTLYRTDTGKRMIFKQGTEQMVRKYTTVEGKSTATTILFLQEQ